MWSFSTFLMFNQCWRQIKLLGIFCKRIQYQRVFGFLIYYCSPIYLTEMSDSLPTTPLTCGPNEVYIDGTCKSEDSAAVFMAYACLLVLGQTAKQSGGQGLAMRSGMHRRPPHSSA